jgi:hypothetical protein
MGAVWYDGAVVSNRERARVSFVPQRRHKMRRRVVAVAVAVWHVAVWLCVVVCGCVARWL